MVDDEEPPALSSAGRRATLSTGGPPPPSAFGSNSNSSSGNSRASSDLSSRWKQYEAEKTTTKMEGPDGPAHNDYDLYETPEKERQLSSAAQVAAPRQLYAPDSNLSETQEPRRSYSLTKSSSYNTDDLIAKYSGGSRGTLSNASASSNSAIPSSARIEAVKVLNMADEQIDRNNSMNMNMNMNMNTNQPFQVRRTETGGFSASAVPEQEPAFSFKRSSSNSRRTPSALSGLGLNKSSPERGNWKSGRYAFSDPKFREDDYLAEEEDDIIGPAVADPLEDENEARKKSYRKHNVFDNVGFDGDFPGQGVKSSWSSRYSDNPNATNTSSILDRYDRSHVQSENKSSRQSARNMFISTASNVKSNVRAFGDNVSKGFNEAKNNSKAFGKGFSFKDNRKGMSAGKGGATATGATNLRTVWKDDNFNDEEDDLVGDHKQHKTWEQVAHQKKRRRKIGLSFLCLVVTAIIIGVSLSQTAWRWKYKNLWRNGNTHMDVTFYATSNTPFGYGTTEDQLVQDLNSIPSDAEFVTHLGNLQDSSLGMCPAARMPEVASLLGRSPVPIYIVPGEHDWIRCPNQLTAFDRWLAAFGSTQAFEKENSLVSGGTNAAASAGEFDRPKSTPDIFSKLHHGVLFFGLHLVSGTVTEGEGMVVQTVRDAKMEIFVRGTLDRLKGEYRSIVLLGNARPGPQQNNFFDSIREDLKDARVPVAYVHSHSGFGETEHYPFGSKKSRRGDVLDGMLAIQAASGGANQPPLKITVGFGKSPFKVGDDDN